MDRHEYKRQNAQRDAERKARLAQEVEWLKRESARSRPFWRKCLNWRPVWWSVPSEKFAAFVAFFTFALVVVAYLQLSAMTSTDQAIHKQLEEAEQQRLLTIAQLRANLIPQDFQLVVLTDGDAIAQAGQPLRKWTLIPQWKNVGVTDAIGYRAWFNIDVFDAATAKETLISAV